MPIQIHKDRVPHDTRPDAGCAIRRRMLQIGDITLSSRLIVGTGKYPDFATMKACHEASETGLVTLALRRVDLGAAQDGNILEWIDRTKIHLLPNTAGCYTAEDAVATARIARELLGTSLLKLEVIGCPRTLFPDAEGTLEACLLYTSPSPRD